MALTFAGSRSDLRSALRGLAAALAGRGEGAQYTEMARGIKLRVGVALLSKIQSAFLVKARGGTDEAGIKWQELSPYTIARRRTTKAELRSLGVGGKRVRGLLTPKEDKRWRQIFATRKASFMGKFGMSEADASARAAQIAWATLKAEGAKTKLAVLGSRNVEILRDTGILLQSFAAGFEDTPSGADGQIFETPPGKVVVGTNKKPWHHKGIPGKLPARPYWPADGKLPSEWNAAITDAARTGVVRALELLAKGI